MAGQRKSGSQAPQHNQVDAQDTTTETPSRSKLWREKYNNYMRFSLKEKMATEMERQVPDLEQRKGSFWAYWLRKRPFHIEDGPTDIVGQESEEENE